MSAVAASRPEPITFTYAGRPRRVRFLGRPNRYLARIAFLEDGAEVDAHVPNPGRMGELLRAGRTQGYVVPAAGPGRKTSYDLVSVRHAGELVSIDSRVANRVVGRVLAAGGLPEFGTGAWRAEPRWGNSRFDFGLGDRAAGYSALLEVKSSNLMLGDHASFPDAPTVRGTRHVTELAQAARRGVRAGVLFVIQREAPERFRPNEALDPGFTKALRAAAVAGVRVAAHSLEVTPAGVRWGRPVPVALGGRPTGVHGTI